MPRPTVEESSRHTLFNRTLDYDDYNYRRIHDQLNGETCQIDYDCKFIKNRYVLIYYMVMANEVLNELQIKGNQRISHLRYMFDNYNAGDTPGVKEEHKPDYLRFKSKTLVGELLENNSELKVAHSRILNRSVLFVSQ
jgi:hypothetical protein